MLLSGQIDCHFVTLKAKLANEPVSQQTKQLIDNDVTMTECNYQSKSSMHVDYTSC